MQCPSCRAVYSNGLDFCPRCKTPASQSSTEIISEPVINSQESIALTTDAVGTEDTSASSAQTPVQASSTLLEFPGVSRASRPQWRKDLSERVREIQERRSREAANEVEEVIQSQAAQVVEGAVAPQLGLVPQQDPPALNPIVAAALKRLERARQSSQSMPRTRASMGGAAAAAMARVTEEQYQAETAPATLQTANPVTVPVGSPVEPSINEIASTTKTAETIRERSLVVVPAKPLTKVSEPTSKAQPKRLSAEAADENKTVSDDDLSEPLKSAELYDDRAPVLSRIMGSVIDLLVVGFASSPFAATIELTNGNWSDWRVLASMGGIVLIVMFLYLTASTALAGRTWGMSVTSLRAVDAETGLPPTTKQSVGRAILYIASLITLGLGILYALFDAEGRTAHDHLSGTAVVRE
jgi:uncharacterized RDD family membrane protein YckC